MSGVIRSERGVSRLSSAEVKGTILSEQMDVAELSSLSLPLHFPFNSLSLPASELAKVEKTYYFVSSLETLCFSRKNKVFLP